MSSNGNDAQSDPEPPETVDRPAFPWAFYLFGMVTTAPLFTFFALRDLDPKRGGWLPRGWIDPSLAFLVLPIIGALIGLALVIVSNLAYVFWIKSQRRSERTRSSPP